MSDQHYTIRGDWFRYKDEDNEFNVRISQLHAVVVEEFGVSIHARGWLTCINCTPKIAAEIIDKITSHIDLS